MWKLAWLTLVLVLVAGVLCGATREFTLADGTKVQATVRKFNNGTVVLVTADGMNLLAIERFSVEDQAWIREAFPGGDRQAPVVRATPKPKTAPAVQTTPPRPATKPKPKKQPKGPVSIGALPDTRMPIPSKVGVGDLAPNIGAMVYKSSETVSLEELRGKIVVVEFWAIETAAYRKELPYLKHYYKQFKDRGYEVISVVLEPNRGEFISYRDHFKITWPTVQDRYHRLIEQWGVTGLPTRLLIDQNGRVISNQVSIQNLGAYLEKYLGAANR